MKLSSKMLETGIPAEEDLAAVTPKDERFARGPVAIVECFQQIPCDPCVDACRLGAIAKPNGINDLPVVDFDLCNGCGACIPRCPGLAVFVVDKTYSETHTALRIPYELLPVPSEGEFVACLDRAGKKCGSFEVIKVTGAGSKDRTMTVWLAVPHELAMEIRAIRIGDKG